LSSKPNVFIFYSISHGIRFTNHLPTCNNSHLSAKGRRLQGHATAIGNDLLLSVIPITHSAMQHPIYLQPVIGLDSDAWHLRRPLTSAYIHASFQICGVFFEQYHCCVQRIWLSHEAAIKCVYQLKFVF
jgi:hypothetical protein